MSKPSFSGRVRYSFENLLSKGTPAIIGLLALFSLSVIAVAAAIILLSGLGHTADQDMNFAEAAWQTMLHTIDSGTVAGDSGWGMRFIMFLVTLSGIFIVSILIGSITSGLESKLQDLRKGRSKVLEKNHTLILGWSSKVHSIVSELVIANANQKDPRIVILAPKDKVEMEDEIRDRLPNARNTKIICRTGSPLDVNDLEIVSPNEARSTIILSSDGEHADTEVIKTILALTGSSNRNGNSFHIVAEIKNPENLEVAQLVGKGEVTLVQSADLIAKVTAQTCRQSGLSVVYTELLDFDGAEMYFTAEPKLVGKTYKDALFGFEDSTVIGLRLRDGEILLNPSMTTKIQEGDKIITIAEDDDTIVYKEPPVVETKIAAVEQSQDMPKRERTLILGWNEKGPSIIKELDNYVGSGSEVHIIAETVIEDTYLSQLRVALRNQSITCKVGKITHRLTLEDAHIEAFDHVIVLCYRDLEPQQADAETLIALLHLRNISDRLNKHISIVSEMLDIKNRDLAQIAKADDFIVSDKLVSLMLSQLSENGDLKKVFDQLFTAEGSEIYLKPIEKYLPVGEETNFYTLVENAAQRGETAIGYKRQSLAHDPVNAFGVVVNPCKSERITFSKDDRLIVLAEN